MSIEEVKNLSSGEVIDNIENIYDTLKEIIKSKENVTLPNMVILASQMIVMLDIYKLSLDKKIDLVVAVILDYIGKQDFEEEDKTILLEYVKNDLSNLIRALLLDKQTETIITSDENNVSSSGIDTELDKKEKKGKNIIGLLRVAVSLCNCLSKKYVEETEGIWV
jgi:hypothetical protein